jgi:hypothetical protein
MEMAIWRGHIENLTGPDPRGAAECRVGKATVRLPSDLVANVAEGDRVLVAGSSADGVLNAMAVHNLTRDRLTQIDPSNQVLLSCLWGFVGLMSLAIGWMYPMGAVFVICNGLAVVGTVGAIRCINGILRVARAANWIRYPASQ